MQLVTFLFGTLLWFPINLQHSHMLLNMLHLLFYNIGALTVNIELCPFVSLVFDTHTHTCSYSSLILDIQKHVYALEINCIFCNLIEMIYRKSI